MAAVSPALAILLLALGLNKPFEFPFTISYAGSLAYLAVFGSVVAFGLFLSLVGRIGAPKAAYATLLIPVVALQASAMVEDYHWSGWALAGIALILTGNVIILKSRSEGRSHTKPHVAEGSGSLVKTCAVAER